jgi:peroxiredoxin Q/BCP
MVKGSFMAKAKKKVAKKITKKVTKKAPAKKGAKKKVTKVIAKKGTKQSAGIIKSGIPQIGDMAPDFILKDQNGKSVSLQDYRGMNIVLYFYPKAMTPGCTVQACSLRDAEKELKDLEIVVLGVSPDAVNKLKKFEEKDKLNFRLLSDEDHGVADAYGSWGPKKFMGREYDGILRQSFLIDKKGKIAHVMHKVETKNHHDQVIEFFKHQ